MTSITLTAPAKVNLFLKVLNKRKDGYHNINTVFERISLADKVTISKIPEGIIVSSDKFITSNPKDNLVYKAARLILEYRRVNKGKEGTDKGTGMNKGVEIRVTKRIPIAAGLGGGSSDAAGVLIGINKLYNLKLCEKELIKLGKKLGSDVPFFLLNSPFALGTARGDELKRLGYNKTLWHLIIYPGFKLATKDIYAAFDLLTIKDRDVKIPRYLTGSPEEILYNDLGRAAIAENEVLGRIVERLAYHLGRKAIVSGSGPSVFCLYRTGKEAIAAKDRLFRNVPASERKSWQVFIARTET